MGTRPTAADDANSDGGKQTGTVHHLGTYNEVPPANIPLEQAGRGVYEEWCRTLLKDGLLTLKSREYVEMLAIATDDIAITINKGKRPSRQAMEAKRMALLKLEKLDSNRIIGAASGSENIYGAFGFAKRAKMLRTGKT